MTQESSPHTNGTAQHTALWQELLTSALVGTARQPLRLPPPGTPITDRLAELDPTAPERALLGAAALLGLYRRAGQLPAGDATPAPEPCPPEEQPVCTPRAGEHLALMLGKGHREVLPEWLAAVAAAGQRVPHTYLVALLDAGQKQAALRPQILPVLGRRGRWLAAQNPAWDYANADLISRDAAADPAQLTAVWETGNRITRQMLLRQVREQQPAQARELVATTWDTEKANDRSSFVATFATGLSTDDEPFLEAALDDRSQEVRRTAADLLARLPTSHLIERMISRVQPLLTWLPENPPQIAVTLPEACDAAMIRDSIEPKPPRHSGFGEKAWWLMQMLSAIPPAFWAQRWKTTPEQLLTAAGRDEAWRDLFFEGWTRAAQRRQDHAWIEALLEVRFKKIIKTEIQELLPLPAPERMEALIFQALDADTEPLHAKHPALWMLKAGRHTWSSDLTHTILANLRRRTAEKGRSADYEMRTMLSEFALRMPPELYAPATDGWPQDSEHWKFWSDGVRKMLDILRFRHTMLKEFQQ
jgi:hypothetical protein